MLRVGLSGGIGSGKSTVAQRLVDHGAALIDADALAREVVAPGSAGLAAVVEQFGQDILDADGALDRPAMARRIFGDERARAELNSIIHPRVRARTAELVEHAPADAIVVHDVPLLVEAQYGADYHLVLIVDAPVEKRVRRLAERGLDEFDARARIAAQASDEQRRATADVWLDNAGEVSDLLAEVDRLWYERLVPFEANVRLRRRAPHPDRLIEHHPKWSPSAARLIARIQAVAGERASRVDHVGPTAVPALAAKDILDLQISVRSMADADALADPLGAAGFPVVPEIREDSRIGGDPRLEEVGEDRSGVPGEWEKRCHTSADPGQCANLHLRVSGTAGWRCALLFRDWLRADDQARAEYERVTRALTGQHGADCTSERESWFATVLPRALEWARRAGWTPPRRE